MAILEQENFDTGAQGQAVTAAATIFTDVNTGITYTTGIEGGLAALVNPAGTAAMSQVGFTNMGVGYFRFALKIPSNYPVTDNIVIAQVYDGDLTTGLGLARIQLRNNGQLRLTNMWTAVATSTTVLQLNTTYVVEWKVDAVANTQELRIYGSLSQSATVLETLTGAMTQTTDVMNHFRLGKMSTTTWTGGIIIDSYRRMDSWYAGTAVVGSAFDFNPDGTAGNNVTLPQDWTQTGGLPVYADGGPHTDQTVARYAGQSAGGVNRYIKSPQLPADKAWHERFYINLEAAPVTDDQNQTVWTVENAAGDAILFRLVEVAGSGGLIDLELWGDNYGVLDATPGGRATNLPIGTWIRIELYVPATAGPTSCQAKIWVGARKNLTTNPDFTLDAQSTGTTSTRYRTFGQRLANASSVHKAVSIEAWKTSDVLIGPLAVGEQFDPPTGLDWEFFEYVDLGGGLFDEIPLNLAGIRETGSTVALDITNTSIQGDTVVEPPSGTQRFSGDPGEGKILVSWNSAGTVWSTHYSFQTRLRQANPGSGFSPNPNIEHGYYRIFEVMSNSTDGNEIFGTHGTSTTTWLEGRQGAANSDIINISYDLESAKGTRTKVQRFIDGYYDPWIVTLATKIKDVYDRYGCAVHINFANEPDAWSKAEGWSQDLTALSLMRQAHRRLHFALIAEDVPRDAFDVTTPVVFNQVGIFHARRWQNGYAVDGLQNDSAETSRLDAIHHYYPDWKGVSDRSWANAWSPNPAHFYQKTDTSQDQWGYGTGPILRVYAMNSYCHHENDMSSNRLTAAEFATHTFSQTTDGSWGSHGGGHLKFLRGLHGPKGLPISLNEWSPAMRLDNNYVGDVPASIAHMQNVHIPDLVASNVFAVNKWRWDDFGSNTQVAGSFGFKYGPGVVPDPLDTHTKYYATMWSNPAVINPKSSGPDAPSKPLSPQHQ